MTTYEPTARTTLRRIPARALYDRASVHVILDEALLCHLGFVEDGHPFVVPTAFVRDDETLYVHGAAASRTLRTLAAGVRVCVEVTLLDGLVLARSAFHHSMNYRSVLAFGTAHEVTDREEKLRALSLLVEKISPGRSPRARAPNDKELHATRVLSFPLLEVSAKVRQGGPLDDPEDMGWPVWAGCVPLALRAGVPVVDGPMGASHEAPGLPGPLL
jgi:nitroimidazol reductase NimA-like FMN-containing flavoprotein (pyridoxamine 5'-phosphate oxidase superfamily)